VLTFRVPTESATASTTEVAVTMPTATPIASASVEPVPGWTATVSTTRLAKPIETDDGRLTSAVSRIVWKADSAAAAIAPGEFQRFSVSAGPLPDVPELVLPTLQTYSDGTSVNWNERASGSAEPEHPAPVLRLAAAADEPAASAPATAAASADATAASGDTAALAVGIVAVVLAAAALVVAVIGLLRSARRAA
jgi:uncharacterized protein YcnI